MKKEREGGGGKSFILLGGGGERKRITRWMDATEVRSQRSQGEGDNDSGGAQKPLCPRAVDWRFGLGRTEEEEEASKAIRLLSLYNEGPLSHFFLWSLSSFSPDAFLSVYAS